jgi:segregation and condensation protein A
MLKSPVPPRQLLQTAAVPPTVRLEAFEGPLDLLLHLVRAGRMDVFDLPIAALCDQYLARLAAMESLDLTIAGEFFVMAATLLEIKSRLLLPAPPKQESEEDDEDADPRAELVRRLLEYGKYQQIAELLRGGEDERRQVFFRDTLPWTGHLPPRFGELSADEMLRALQRLLAEAGAGERAVTSVRRRKITLRMKMRETLLRAEAAGAEGVTLAELLPPPPLALFEVVLLFLALLELLKAGSVLVAQERFCGDIRVFFVPPHERAVLIDEVIEEGIAA